MVSALSPVEAWKGLHGVERQDPTGRMSLLDLWHLARAGQCFGIKGDGLELFYVLRVIGRKAWVSAARGVAGRVDGVVVLDGVITAQAQGLDAVACRTGRRGLVKKLKALGWCVREQVPGGWVMEKGLM